jgi:hypothetical protein
MSLWRQPWVDMRVWGNKDVRGMEPGGRPGAISRRNRGAVPRKHSHPASLRVLTRVRREANAGAPGRLEGGGVLVGQDPVDRRSVHLEQRGNDLHGLALGAQGARMGDLLRRQFGLGAECDPTLPSGWDTGAGAFGHQTTLQFSQDANHLPHGAAGGCLRVNMLRQRAKRDAVGTQLIQQGDEVTQATASAVQFPDNEGIAWAEGFEAPGERRALGCRA